MSVLKVWKVILLAIDAICLNLKNLKLNPKVQIEFYQTII